MITETMKDQMKHAIGLDYKTPYTRHGRRYYRPYRNYYCTKSDDKVWAELKAAGYAEHDEPGRNDLVDYRLTRAGLDWLGKELDIMIYDEETEVNRISG